MTDLSVEREGNLFLLTANSELGKAWVDEHLPNDAMTWGRSVVVEHRYIDAIVEGANDDGLTVE